MEINRIGIFYLQANGSKYACTALSLKMEIGAVMSANVTIASGIDIDGQFNQHAEQLLAEVTGSQKKAEMVACQVYESGVTGDTKLFDGYIASGALSYSTNGSRTVRAIQFVCLGKTCMLYGKPFTAYVNMCGAAVINYFSNQVQAGVEDAGAMANLLMSGKVDSKYLVGRISTEANTDNLAVLTACLVDAVVAASTYGSNDDMATGNLVKVGDYIFSKHKLDASLLGDSCKEDFAVTLCERLLANMKVSSVFDSIRNSLETEEYMLHLIPRWSGSDFKMELAPSKAWEGSTLSVQPESIIGISTVFNPVAGINAPEAFIVNFSSAIETLHNESIMDYLGSNGIYSPKPELAQAIANVFQSGAFNAKSLMWNQLFKTRMYNAPSWLHPAFIDKASPGSQTKDKNEEGVAAQKTPEVSEENKVKLGTVTDLVSAQKLGNEIAKALYTFIYGATDTARLTLDPGTRFGNSGVCFEDNLGEVIDVYVVKGTADNGVNVRGMIKSVMFEYSFAGASSCRYTMELSHVRPLDPEEKPVVCPLYHVDTRSTGI